MLKLSVHTHMHNHSCTHMHTHTFPHTHTHLHTRSHMHAHSHSPAHQHTRTCPLPMVFLGVLHTCVPARIYVCGEHMSVAAPSCGWGWDRPCCAFTSYQKSPILRTPPPPKKNLNKTSL